VDYLKTYAFVRKEKEQQRFNRLETRNSEDQPPLLMGMDDKNTNLQNVAQKLKTYCACGGNPQERANHAPGDHRDRVKNFS
jgi:translation initiation factor 1 (eIF-1/SUI1)